MSGTITVPSGFQASGATVNVYTGTSVGPTPTATPSVTCSNGPCTTGTYSASVALGSAYTVQATLTGFQPAGGTTAPLTAAAPTATQSATLTPLTHSVDVTVTSADGSLALPGASVTISTSANSYTATANASGVADFTGVVPDQGANYSIRATLDGVTATGSVQVQVQSQASDPIQGSASGSAGQLSGTITLTPAPSGPLDVTIDYCTGSPTCATPAFTQTVSIGTGGTGSYGGYLPAAAYYVSGRATGYTTASGGPTTLADGATITGPPVALAP